MRKLNADALAKDDALGFYAIADGVGSSSDSAHASSFIADKALAIVRAGYFESPDLSWGGLIAQLHVDYIAEFADRGTIPATTLSMVLIRDGLVHFTTVGDSPIFLLYGDTIALLSRHHTAVDQHVIYSNFSALKSQDGSNILVNAFGRQRPRPIEYAPIDVTLPARIILASDGLLDFVTQDGLRDLSRAYPTPGALCRQIENAAKSGRPRDNYSAIVVDLTGVDTAL